MLACEEPQTTSSSVRVEDPHAAADLVGEAAVFVGGLVADLPGPVHLVAEAPDLDVVRLAARRSCGGGRSSSCPPG